VQAGTECLTILEIKGSSRTLALGFFTLYILFAMWSFFFPFCDSRDAAPTYPGVSPRHLPEMEVAFLSFPSLTLPLLFTRLRVSKSARVHFTLDIDLFRMGVSLTVRELFLPPRRHSEVVPAFFPAATISFPPSESDPSVCREASGTSSLSVFFFPVAV